MTPLVIAHSIFLTTAERHKLTSGKATVETVGISAPVKLEISTNEKLTEIFCRYLLTNEISGPEVELMEGGYKLYINDTEKWIQVSETPEDNLWMSYEVETPMTFNGKRFLVTHQIVVQDVSDLERSTVCENLGRYLGKVSP